MYLGIYAFRKLRDRAWMAGDKGLPVGNSVAALTADDTRRLTTASELPFGDAALEGTVRRLVD